MLRSLIRWKFVDETWTANDFDALGAFWLALYDEANHLPEGDWRSEQTLEIYLFGFPRSAGPTVGSALARQLAEASIPVEVSAFDPDTLVAKTKPRPGDRRPFEGFGVHALTGPLFDEFDGLVFEFRYTVADAGPVAPAPGLCGATLVVVGELRNGGVAVKSVWFDPAFVRDETIWSAGSTWEFHILEMYTRYRRRGRVNRRFANDVFNPAPAPTGLGVTLRRWWSWLTSVRCEGPRVRGVLLRCGILAGLAALTVGAFALGVGFDLPVCGVLSLAFGCFTLTVAGCFVTAEFPYLFGNYYATRLRYNDMYRRVEQYDPVPPDAPAPWRTDPTIRKLTAEMIEAGYTYFADAISVPAERAEQVHRIFRAPDGISYLVLAFQFASNHGEDRLPVWPTRYCVLCQTFAENGDRFETTDFQPTLVGLRRVDPTCRVLVVPGGTSPIDTHRAHVKAAAGWLAEEGERPLRHEPADAYIDRQEEISAQQRRVYRAWPYSWDDHIRWYLQLDAKPPAPPPTDGV